METLLLRLLPHEAENAEWVIVGGDRRTPAPASGPLHEAAPLVRHRRVVLLVPGEDVLLTQVTLQTRNRAQLAKAVPYALEDELAEDIEQLHFALGPRQADGVLPVAVVARARLNGWLERLGEAGIIPHAVIPDLLALPLAENAWSLLLENDRALLRTGACTGFAVEPADLAELLTGLVSETESPPASLEVYRCAGAEDAALPGPSPLPLEPRDDCPPELFARGLQEKTVFNLLQGTYRSDNDLGRFLRPLKAVAVLATIWLGLQFVLMAMDYRQLSAQDEELTAAIEQIYRETFPNTNRVVNARVQMEQRLNELTSGNADDDISDFMLLLQVGGTATDSVSGVRLDSLDYSDHRLDLSLTADDLQSLETITSRIEEAGLEPDIDSADTRGSQVNARLSIRRGEQ